MLLCADCRRLISIYYFSNFKFCHRHNSKTGSYYILIFAHCIESDLVFVNHHSMIFCDSDSLHNLKNLTKISKIVHHFFVWSRLTLPTQTFYTLNCIHFKSNQKGLISIQLSQTIRFPIHKSITNQNTPRSTLKTVNFV